MSEDLDQTAASYVLGIARGAARGPATELRCEAAPNESDQ